MKIYLVGGAVRDQLLGAPIKERDWVVVGATPEKMRALGYRQVGRGFPVFLHPKTHEEYALARTERKTGHGYTQFVCETNTKITLEDDLRRRDLTINAIAQTKAGKIIDPFHGREDLKNKILRHVSPAFAEDPLRVLRVARFAARFGDFQIHPKTMALMQKIVRAGEMETLVQERVWQELERALQEKYPERFFLVLKKCGALKILFPELLPHLTKSLKALKVATRLSPEGAVRFATLFYNTKYEKVQPLFKRMSVLKTYRELALLVIKNQTSFQNALKLNARQLLKALEKLDALRRAQRFQHFLLACESHSKNIPSLNLMRLKEAYKIIANVSTRILKNQHPLTGLALKFALQKARIKALEYFISNKPR